jgi:hypothetical protein
MTCRTRAPGGLASASEVFGTYYSKASCEYATHDYNIHSPDHVHRVYHCASNGGPASQSPTSWTLYGDRVPD